MGRLTQNPEIRYSQGENQTTVGRISIAVDRKYKREGEPQADFFNCVGFGKQAEFMERYLRKGIKVLITGRVQNNNYINKEGEKVYSVQITLDEIEFAESKNASMQAQETDGRTPTMTGRPDFMSIPEGIEEELPFS